MRAALLFENDKDHGVCSLPAGAFINEQVWVNGLDLFVEFVDLRETIHNSAALRCTVRRVAVTRTGRRISAGIISAGDERGRAFGHGSRTANRLPVTFCEKLITGQVVTAVTTSDDDDHWSQ